MATVAIKTKPISWFGGASGILIKGETYETIAFRNDRLLQHRGYRANTAKDKCQWQKNAFPEKTSASNCFIAHFEDTEGNRLKLNSTK